MGRRDQWLCGEAVCHQYHQTVSVSEIVPPRNCPLEELVTSNVCLNVLIACVYSSGLFTWCWRTTIWSCVTQMLRCPRQTPVVMDLACYSHRGTYSSVTSRDKKKTLKKKQNTSVMHISTPVHCIYCQYSLCTFIHFIFMRCIYITQYKYIFCYLSINVNNI